MKSVRLAVKVLLGAAQMAGCTDRNAPTAFGNQPGIAFDAAAAQTSVITDPVGDVKNKAPAWLDIVSASIIRNGGRFSFQLELAGPVPADPALDPATPSHTDHLCWGDGLRTDASAPVGYPFGKNTASHEQFYPVFCWNPTGSFGLGTGFIGFLIDRRPLLTGGQAIIEPVEFSVQETRVTLVVDATALGDPATFAWAAFTEQANQADPNDASWFPDVAPDVFSGAPWATWPQ
jgi:hypothetical protein